MLRTLGVRQFERGRIAVGVRTAEGDVRGAASDEQVEERTDANRLILSIRRACDCSASSDTRTGCRMSCVIDAT